MVRFWVGFFAFCSGKKLWLFIFRWPLGSRLYLLPPAEKPRCLFGLSKVWSWFVYSCLLRREEDRELNGLYDLSWRRKVSHFLLLLKMLLENWTVSSSCQQGGGWTVTSFCWGRNITGCPLALNPGTHSFVALGSFSETLSNGCPY